MLPAKGEIDKTSKKMTSTVEWYRKEMSLLTNRALGRVTPAILDSVRVQLPDVDVPLKLSEVATVGVKEGTVLVVTAFDEHVRIGKFVFWATLRLHLDRT